MSAARPHPVDEVALGRIYQAGWWVVLIGAAVGVGAGLWLAEVVGERITVTVEVLVKPLGGEATSDAGPGTHNRISLDNEARVVRSDAVLGRARAALADRPALDVLRDVSVEAFPGSTVLQLGVTTRNAAVSRQRVTAIATAYLAARAGEARRVNDAERTSVRQQLDQARTELARGQGEEHLVEARIRQLQERLDEVDRFMPDPGTVLRGPSDPRHSAPPALLTVTGATLVGVLLGLFTATVLARRRNVDHPGDGDNN
jgi:succinoglycan biosynthesis transport protein ExoP